MSNVLESSIGIPFSDLIVDTPLGRGAAGFVFKFIAKKHGKIRACKVFDKKIAQSKETGMEKILNEIQIHSELKHDHIVKYYSQHEDSDNIYVILEYCDGGDLGQAINIANGRMTEKDIKYYGYQLALGIKYLHDHEILHRDIKLSNILFNNNKKTLKICDFGLAIRLKDLQQEKKTWCGTPNYIAPEIALRKSYGLKADIWSYGCVLYAMYTGAPPFEGKTAEETIQNLTSQNFNYPKGISNEFKELLVGLINWAEDSRFDINAVINHSFFTNTPFVMELTSAETQQAKRALMEKGAKIPDKIGQELPEKMLDQKNLNEINEDNSGDNILRDFTNQQDRIRPVLVDKNRGSGLKNGSNLQYSQEKPQKLLNKTQNSCLSYGEDKDSYENSPKNGRNNKTSSLDKPREYPRCDDSDDSAYLRLHFPNHQGSGSRPYLGYTTTTYDTTSMKENINPLGNIKQPENEWPSQNTSSRFTSRGLNLLKNAIPQPPSYKHIQSKGIYVESMGKYAANKANWAENRTNTRVNNSQNLDNMLNLTLKTTTSEFSKGNTAKSFCSERGFNGQSNIERPNPLCTYGLKPMKFNTNHGFVEINDEGWIIIEVPKHKRTIGISANGLKIKITKTGNIYEEKLYELPRLPMKYLKFYQYAVEVCEKISSKAREVDNFYEDT